jgi:hypothetical protein
MEVQCTSFTNLTFKHPQPPKKQITDHSISAFELEEMAPQEVVEGPVGTLLGAARVRWGLWGI